MQNLLVFVSSFGYGHLTRTIAIIRLLLKKTEKINIILIGLSEHCSFFLESMRLSNEHLKNRIKVHRIITDVGLYYNKYSLKPDIKESINQAYSFYVKQKEKTISKLRNLVEEYSNCLIYSDISPLALDLADELEIYSISASNFDWYSVFNNLPTENKETKEKLAKILENLEQSYSKSNLLIKLPLSDSENFAPLEDREILEVGFFAREKTIEKSVFRSKFGISQDDITVFISMGLRLLLSFDKLNNNELKLLDKSVHFFTSNINNPPQGITCIPFNETEGQNWVGNCDLFIGKPGWGSISECIMNNVKMMLFPIPSNSESKKLLSKSLQLGGTRSMSFEEFEEMKWINSVRNTNVPEYKKNINKTGAKTIIDRIINLF